MSDEPVFKHIFGQQWSHLLPVFKKHYSLRPYSSDTQIVKGEMEIQYSRYMCCLMPIYRLFKTLVPLKAKNIPVTVKFSSRNDTNVLFLERTFYFSKPYKFNSYMQVVAHNEIVEVMRFGIGWRMKLFYDGQKVQLQHQAYIWKIGKWFIRLPIAFLVGRGYAEEEAIDDNTYRMKMTISHFLFGEIYCYAGTFRFQGIAC